MLKGLVLVPIALAIDLLQAVLMLALMGISTVAGGILSLIPVVGPAVGAAGMGVGYGVAYAVDVGLSFGLGAFLVSLLWATRLRYPKAFAVAGVVELVAPFLPGWTLLVLRSLYLAHKQEARTQQHVQPA